jgi:hypothetical protein
MPARILPKLLSVISNKCIKLVLAVVVIGFVLTSLHPYAPSTAKAATGINQIINFQGKVTNANGTNVTDGAYDFVLKIYDGAGSAASTLFTETWSNAALFSSTMSSAPGSGGELLTYTSNTNESTLQVGQILWNITKKESVKITTVNNSTNVLGISPTRQAWATGDTISNRIYVKDGLFIVSINSLNKDLSGVNFNSDTIYLGINFNADGEMKPRIQFTSVPYAFNALQVNGLAVTNNGGNVLNIAANKTLTINNTLTFTGTDSTSFTLPTSSDTIAGIAATQALTNKTINGLTVTSTTGILTLASGKTLTTNNSLTLAGTDGKTLTLSNSLTLTGTDGSSVNFGAGGTVCYSGGCAASAIRLDQITAATGTATIANGSNAIAWNWGTLTSQTGMTFGGGAAMTTGSTVAISGTFAPSSAGTGQVLSLTDTNTSTNSAGSAKGVALNIATTFSTTSGGGTHENYGLYVQPVTNSSTKAGTNNSYGIRIGDQGNAAYSVAYGLYVDSQSGTGYSARFDGSVGIKGDPVNADLEIAPSGTSASFRLSPQNTNDDYSFIANGNGLTISNATKSFTILNEDQASHIGIGGLANASFALKVTGATSFSSSVAATTYNGLAITANGTNTLAIAAGKTATISNTLTFTGTDSSSVAFGTGGTVCYTGACAASTVRLDQITAANTTATIANLNNAIAWNWGTLTTQTGITFGGGSAMTTGTILALGSGTYVHTTTETGNATTLAVTDASTNASGATVTNGLNIAATINTSGAGTKTINGLNIAAPTNTACASGACTYNGLKITGGSISNITSTALRIDAGSGAGTNYAASFINGNVGIGTATPGASLDILGPSTGRSQIGFLSDATTYGALGFTTSSLASTSYTIASSGLETLLNTPSATSLKLRVNNIDKIVMDSNGNLTMTPTTNATTTSGLSLANTFLHITPETGNLAAISFTDASTNASGATVTNGLNIAATINTTGAGTKTITGLNIAAPTVTACTTGACTYNGLKVTGASIANVTSTALAVDAGTGAGTEYAASFMNGNVGIGTATPTSLLTLGGSSGSGTYLTFNQTGSNTYADITTASTTGGIRMYAGTAYTTGPAFQIWATGSSFQGMYFDAGNATGADINFRKSPNGANAMTITQGTGLVTLTTVAGAGLANCRNNGERLIYNSTTKQFGCDTDRIYTIKAADTTKTSSTTFTTPTDMSFPVAANETWIFHFTASIDMSSAGASGVKFKVIGPTSPTACVFNVGSIDDGNSVGNTSCGTGLGAMNTVDTNPNYFDITGSITNGANAGTLALQWAQGSASGTEIFRANSSIVEAYRVSGADLAEAYATKDSSITAGDIVSTDGSLAAGVQKSSTAYDSTTLGVVSTAPGQVLGSQIDSISRPVLLGLTGRVPTKVSTENGSIRAGDYITASSVPGVGMKATKPGATIGKALESYTGTGVGKISVFLSLSYQSNGDSQSSNTNTNQTQYFPQSYAQEKLSSGTVISLSGGKATKSLKGSTALGIAVAGQNTINATGTHLLGVGLSGQLPVTVSNEQGDIKTDDQLGTQSLYQGVAAKSITTDNVALGQALTDAPNLNCQAANSVEQITWPTIPGNNCYVLPDGAHISQIMALIRPTSLGLSNNDSSLTEVDRKVFQAFSMQNSVLTSNVSMNIIGNLSVSGGITIGGPAEFKGPTIFKSVADFFDNVIFHKQVQFADHVKFNPDTAGVVQLPKGQTQIAVNFNQTYESTPIINMTRTLADFTDSLYQQLHQTADCDTLDKATCQQQWEKQQLAITVSPVITARSATGFTISLSQPITTDLYFSWSALAVQP